MLNPPPLVPALPSNFILASASEHTDPGEYDMYDGVLWAPERTARQYEFQAETNLKRAKDPLFWVRLSSSVGHKPGTDQFSHEESMDAAFAKVGVKNYKKAKHKWGPYPVLSVSGERPNGSTFFSAWIGTHLPGGWAILVDYRTPQGRGHPTAEERRIWEDFLKKTKAK